MKYGSGPLAFNKNQTRDGLTAFTGSYGRKSKLSTPGASARRTGEGLIVEIVINIVGT